MSEYSYKRLSFKHLYKNAAFNGYLRILRRHIDNAKVSLVDFGASNGNFLLAASKKKWISELAGFEIDQSLIKEAPSSIKGKLKHKDLSKLMCLDSSQETYDIAVSFHVIEHVPDGDLFLKNMSCFLKKGGLLMLATPNLSGLGARTEKSDWMGFKHDHINLYTYNELRSVMSKHGFTELEVGTTLFKGLRMFRWRVVSLMFNDIPLFCRPIWPWSKGEAIIGVWRKN